MGRHTHSVTAMPHCWTRCTNRWLFDKNASDTWMRGQPWGTCIW